MFKGIDKSELETFARSAVVRSDHANMRKNSAEFFRRGKFKIENYIIFVTSANAMINDERKKFVKMTGREFKM